MAARNATEKRESDEERKKTSAERESLSRLHPFPVIIHNMLQYVLFFLSSCAIQLINCPSLSPASPAPPPLPCLHQMWLGDRPYLRPRSSAVMLIYGSITPQLVQTEARSSLIRGLRLWSWDLRQHTDVWECVCTRACVCAFNTRFNFLCFLCSPNTEFSRDRSRDSRRSLNLFWPHNDNLLCPQRRLYPLVINAH